MASVVVYHRPDDGGLSVVRPVDGTLADAEAAVPAGVPYTVMDDSALPPDRAWRDAWQMDGGGNVVIDMARARGVLTAQVRARRAPILARLDVEAIRALEAGDVGKAQAVARQKQALRDAPADPRIAAAKTPDDLAALLPVLLGV